MTFWYLFWTCGLGEVVVLIIELIYLLDHFWDKLRETGVDAFKLMNDDDSEIKGAIAEVLEEEKRARWVFKIAYYAILLRFAYCLFFGGIIK